MEILVFCIILGVFTLIGFVELCVGPHPAHLLAAIVGGIIAYRLYTHWSDNPCTWWMWVLLVAYCLLMIVEFLDA